MPKAATPTSPPLDDPRVRVDRYVVTPTGYDDMVHSDKPMWTLAVVDGGRWGWSVRRGAVDSPFAMNRKGEWICESRGSGHNKHRRFSLEDALALALKHVDTHLLNGCTAAQASAWVAARRAKQQADLKQQERATEQTTTTEETPTTEQAS